MYTILGDSPDSVYFPPPVSHSLLKLFICIFSKGYWNLYIEGEHFLVEWIKLGAFHSTKTEKGENSSVCEEQFLREQIMGRYHTTSKNLLELIYVLLQLICRELKFKALSFCIHKIYGFQTERWKPLLALYSNDLFCLILGLNVFCLFALNRMLIYYA